MERTIGTSKITTFTGDITDQPDVDAIVNAANSRLQGGHGVCGAIFKAAGWSQMSEACMEHEADENRIRCPTGDAKATPAFRLPNKGVIHAVGPIYNPAALLPDQNGRELHSAYRNSLELAESLGWTSICFPAISCGIYGYPVEEAAEIAIEACTEYLTARGQTSIDEIRFVFIPFADGPELQRVFEAALEADPIATRGGL